MPYLVSVSACNTVIDEDSIDCLVFSCPNGTVFPYGSPELKVVRNMKTRKWNIQETYTNLHGVKSYIYHNVADIQLKCVNYSGGARIRLYKLRTPRTSVGY